MTTPTRLSLILVAAALTVVPATALGQPAAGAPLDAAPLPSGVWWEASDGQTETHTEFPTNGVILVPASLHDDAGAGNGVALEHVQASATDSVGAAISGTLAYDGRIPAVIWTADAPFAAGEQYTLTTFFNNTTLSEAYPGAFASDATIIVTVTTGTAAAVPLVPPALTVQSAIESPFYCCDEDPCVLPPQLEVAIEEQLPVAGYSIATVTRTDPGGAALPCGFLDAGVATCIFAQAGDEYCVDVTVESAFDGSAASSQTCVPAAQVTPLPENQRLTCLEPGTAAGCSIAGVHMGTTPWALGGSALLLLGLVGLRRRERLG